MAWKRLKGVQDKAGVRQKIVWLLRRLETLLPLTLYPDLRISIKMFGTLFLAMFRRRFYKKQPRPRHHLVQPLPKLSHLLVQPLLLVPVILIQRSSVSFPQTYSRNSSKVGSESTNYLQWPRRQPIQLKTIFLSGE